MNILHCGFSSAVHCNDKMKLVISVTDISFLLLGMEPQYVLGDNQNVFVQHIRNKLMSWSDLFFFS